MRALFGVVFAGIVAATSDDSVLQVVGDGFDKWAQALGVIVFAASVAWLYNRTQRVSCTGSPWNPSPRSAQVLLDKPENLHGRIRLPGPVPERVTHDLRPGRIQPAMPSRAVSVTSRLI